VPEEGIYDSADALMSLPGYNPDWGTPQYGGVLKLSGPSVTMNFVQYINMGWGPWNVFAYNTLIKVDPWLGMSEGLHPELAKSWSLAGDGMSVTLQLREGVMFHTADSANGRYSIPLGATGHGTELHCDDVKASLEFYAHPPEEAMTRYGSVMREDIGHIDTVSCPDGAEGYTVVVNLSFIRATTLETLGYGRAAAIQNKEYWEWLWTPDADGKLPSNGGRGASEQAHINRMGTGAFMPSEAEPGVFAGGVANPDYFKPGLPMLSGIEGWSIPDATTRYSAWITGKVHLYGGGSSALTPALVEQTQKNYPDYTIHPTYYQLQGVHLNTQRPPFDDVRVRQAIHLALDRNVWRAMKKSGTLEGTILAEVVPPFTPWGHTVAEMETWPGYRQPKDNDIAAANALLDEVYGAGERPGPWECLTRTVATYTDYCLFAVEQIQRSLGVQMTMAVLDGTAANKKRTSCEWIMDANSAFDTNNTFDPTPRLIDFAFSTGYGGRTCNWVSVDPAVQQDIDDRIIAQDQELDPVKRKEMTRALSKELTIDLVPYAIEGHVVSFLGFRPEARGGLFFQVGGQVHQWSQYDRMWFAE